MGCRRPARLRARTSGTALRPLSAARESQIVLGIDPDPARLWPDALHRTSEARAALAQALAAAHETARAVTAGEAAAGEAALAPDLAVDPAALEAGAAVLAHAIALIEAAGPAC